MTAHISTDSSSATDARPGSVDGARPGSVPGMFSLVLHSHLPWFAHHGAWPVGEELLYQAWGECYIPVVEVLHTLANEGYRDLLSLGITPILAAQLDDAYCQQGMQEWLTNREMRAQEAASSRYLSQPGITLLGLREVRHTQWLHERFHARWRGGIGGALRPLSDSGTVELLGGPLAHPFQPLVTAPIRQFSLQAGLEDSALRFGTTSSGIWAPECAYTPGMEKDYAAAGITHFMVDGPALHGDTSLGRPVRDSDVIAFGRDLSVSYRVWSPKAGYPGAAVYRDFHTYHHETGFKPARVTGKRIAAEDKAPYDPESVPPQIDRDVADFVEHVVQRLQSESERLGRPAHVVAAFDTELFGHWWHEGPLWLDSVLRALPAAGVRVGSLATARREGFIGEPVCLEDCSWGSGKDWRVWEGPAVSDIVELNQQVCEELSAAVLTSFDHGAPAPTLGSSRSPLTRDVYMDQVVQEALLALQSDWAFLISKETAADYARGRAHLHAHAFRELVAAQHSGEADRLLANWQQADGPFPQLDARQLYRLLQHS